ncbi:MAG TPA: cytochrome c3 family protein [Gemmatimonadales bacterium]|nr:cytochrome c3 family protein [Gemmatimonadales bacterium]
MRRTWAGALVASALVGAAAVAVARGGPDRFDHAKHAKLFPSCVTCHAGTVDSARALLPPPATCAACHDGGVERRVSWAPREGPRPTNVAFSHAAHPEVTTCAACHAAPESGWMRVAAAAPEKCFACHGEPATPHLAQADTLCATCHLPLARTTPALRAVQVANFPRPDSHHADGFGAGGGHARAAKAGDRSCATCHAQDFCATCHVNGARVPAIQALGRDPRSLAISASARRPASHGRSDFERAHGGLARNDPRACANCHTQESCTACHSAAPSAAPRPTAAATDTTLPRGAAVHRRPPPSHLAPSWASGHGALAGARPQNCAGCHARTQCLECHRPDAAAGERGGYHPRGFLASHPAQAYARATSCAECHNTASFCQDCHVQSGVVASGRLRGGFHDGRRSFLFGHGQAARQSLETCVSCHAERDCLTCHSSVRGRGFDPHGPGFDPRRLRDKNPGLCSACHGATVPQ